MELALSNTFFSPGNLSNNSAEELHTELLAQVMEGVQVSVVGNTMGYPGVFLSNPHPYPSKPAPAVTGMGFYGCGLQVLSIQNVYGFRF